MLKKRFLSTWPFFIMIAINVILFSPFFTQGLLPIPADIIAGVYFPWLDYKWGYSTGVPVKNPLLSDIPSLLYPWRSFAIDQLKSGVIPLWNPYYFSGMPLLANFQSAVFSWVNIFFVFFPKSYAWSLGVILQPFLSAAFLYLFLRNRGISQLSSLLGGVIFALSGFSIAWMEYNVHGHTAYFLPFFLFIIDKFFASKKSFWLFLWSIVIALQIFTGYIPIVIFTYFTILLFVLYFYGLKIVPLAKLAIFSLLGVMLASVQILPGIELVSLSIRNVDPIVGASGADFLPLKHMVTGLVPDFFGNPATGNWWGQAFYDNFYYYAGTLTPLLAFMTVFNLKDKLTRFWLFLFLFSLLVVTENPVALVFKNLLGLKGGVAARFLLMTDFSLAILAPLGLEFFLERRKLFLRHLSVAVLLTLMVFLIAFLFSLSIGDINNRLVAQRNMIIPLVFLLFGIFTLYFLGFVRKPYWRFVGSFLILLLISANLLYSAKKYLPFSKADLVFPETPVINFLKKQQEPFRLEPNDVFPENFWMPYRLEAAVGSDALLPKRMGEFLNAVDTAKIEDKIARVQNLQTYDSPLYRLLSVEYLLSKKMTAQGKFSPEGNSPKRFQETRYTLAFEDKTVQVWQDLEALPRAYWVYQYEQINEGQKIIDRLLDKNFSLGRSVVLEMDPVADLPKQPPKLSEISWLELVPNKLRLKIASDQPGLVLVANSFFPGWKAFLDGKETPIYRANYTFWAIKASAGEHILTFSYQPQSFMYGLILSLLAAWNLFLLASIFLVRSLWLKKFH